MAASNPSVLRRSSRVQMNLPILVTSLEQPHAFSEVCETMMVNAHGCSLRATNKLDAGSPVQFKTRDGQWAMAHIVDCQPLNHGRTSWMLGAKLDKPTNFWGLENYPEDWAQLLEMPSLNKQPQLVKPAPMADLHAVIAELVEPLHAAVSEIRQKLERKEANRSSFDISLSYIPPEVEEKIAIRLREELGTQVMDKTRLQAESVLEATKEAVSEIRQKLERKEANRSSFDISLSYIPPEVEEKIAVRLREELGTQVMDKTRLQAESVLEATKEAVSKRIADARNQFRSELSAELQKVEVRAQGLSNEITAAVQHHFHSAEEQLEKRLLEAGIRLERRGEEFFRTLQHRLGEEHSVYRSEMQQVHASVASEVADIHAETSDLTARMKKLDASANHLEKEMDERLVRVSSDIISGARTQLESALNIVLKDLGTRNSKELNAQLEDASNRLRIVQKGIETSVSDLVRAKVTDSLVSFGQTIEALAQDAVTRWRNGLARDLNSMTDILERKPQVKAASAAND